MNNVCAALNTMLCLSRLHMYTFFFYLFFPFCNFKTSLTLERLHSSKSTKENIINLPLCNFSKAGDILKGYRIIKKRKKKGKKMCVCVGRVNKYPPRHPRSHPKIGKDPNFRMLKFWLLRSILQK